MNRRSVTRALSVSALLAAYVCAAQWALAANSFYNASGTPAQGSALSSAAMRGEFASIGAGFDKMPALTAGTAIVVNGGGTALGNTVGSLALAGNFATTGAFNTTFVQQASISLTLPLTADTLVGRATADTLTNKTLTAPVMTAPVLGTPASGTLTNTTGYLVSNLSGLGTGVGTFLATASSANLASALTDKTGTGVNVFATSPTLVTPVLGVATATSINKVSFTAPASGSTFALADGKTLTVSNTMTLAATDGSAPFTLATRQIFTSGTGATYTTPAGVRQLRIRMVGGGGGGGGGGVSDGGNGGAGGDTQFDGTNNLAKGGGGATGSANIGGTAGTGGAGTGLSLPGGSGQTGSSTSTTQAAIGGGGGSSILGGGAGTAAAAPGYGGGGRGGNEGAAASGIAGGGGGAGEYREIIINGPSATYTYTVGAAGTAGAAGTSGVIGTVGKGGIIIVDEVY